MNNTSDILFRLLRAAISDEVSVSLPLEVDWQKLVELSCNQGVAALAVDGLMKVYEKYPELELSLDSGELDNLKYEWFASCLKNEQSYSNQLTAIENLAFLYDQQSVRMLVLKGYGLSLDYPVPNHRISGDIDIYLYGKGDLGDSLVRDCLGCDVKQNEDKHSVFQIDGISVENHACFVNTAIHPSLKGLNDYFVKEAETAIEHRVGKTYVMLPSAVFNALYLPFHCAGHFVHGDATVKQLCDWSLFVKYHGEEIDWTEVHRVAECYGFWKFFCCLNGICVDYLSVPASCLPVWPRNKKLERKVLDEIVAPRKVCTTVMEKTFRFFSSRWKYRMVYKEGMLATSLRLAKSYLRLRDNGAMSVWEKYDFV